MKKILLLFLIIILHISGYAQHLKKDGTPDMRYKENKANYSTYSYPSNTTIHLKKDGTPDMRYKENNPGYYSANRDSKRVIKRSESAKKDFMKQSGYPNGRSGYVIDHIVPLKKGGCDCPSNMQWQTIEQAKEKDKWESP